MDLQCDPLCGIGVALCVVHAQYVTQSSACRIFYQSVCLVFKLSSHNLLITVAGWEHIYEFLDHIFGEVGSHSGVRMHMGHYAAHITAMIRLGDPSLVGFFSGKHARDFLQTGIALWSQSAPIDIHGPCCDLNIIGGDGTAIGIPVKNVSHLTDVWCPKTTRESLLSWGRNDRCVIRSLGKGKKETKNGSDARKFIKSITSSNANLVELRDELTNFSDVIPSGIYLELQRWLCLNPKEAEWEPLRQLFSCIGSNDSITGLITQEMIPILFQIVAATTATSAIDLSSIPLYLLAQHGMGPEICQIIRCQVQQQGNLQITTVSLFLHLGLCKLKHLTKSHTRNTNTPVAQQITHTYVKCSFDHLFSILSSANDTKSMFDRISGLKQDSLLSQTSSTLEDPTNVGYRYWFSQHGGQIRNKWPLPDGARQIKDETSCEGCQKKRFVYIGHRQRSGLWIWLCIVHQRIIGYHIIKHGEGRRDPLFTLYRFKEVAPKVVYIDFSCGAEESALNWLPEYFGHTEFYHDAFHGYGHICSQRFTSSRLLSLRHLNTSIMEQANSFLQTLRGLLISPRTKVGYSAFCFEHVHD